MIKLLVEALELLAVWSKTKKLEDEVRSAVLELSSEHNGQVSVALAPLVIDPAALPNSIIDLEIDPQGITDLLIAWTKLSPRLAVLSRSVRLVVNFVILQLCRQVSKSV